MPVPYPDVSKEKEQQELCSDTDGACLNLGKKISVPRDLMMEELNLLSNRGSIMFHERLKRVERFTLENIAHGHLNHLEDCLQGQKATQGEKGSEYFTSEIYMTQPGKNNLVTTLKHTVAKKGNPSLLAPGYGGPLKEVPPEKFNVTVIPKSYQSPWEEKPIDSETLLATISTQLPEPPYKLTPANYKCFNSSYAIWWDSRYGEDSASTWFRDAAGSYRATPNLGQDVPSAQFQPYAAGLENPMRYRISRFVKLDKI